MASYRLNAHRSDSTYHTEVARLLQNHFGRPFRQATEKEDQFDADDFIADETAEAPSIEVAARLRSAKYNPHFSCSLLLRSARPMSGNRTELEKILSGKGEFYLYGFRNARRQIPSWLLFNLDKARSHSHFRYVAAAQPSNKFYADSECKDLPLFNGDGEELFPGAIEASQGLFWSDADRDGRPLPPAELLSAKPQNAEWKLPHN